MAQSCLLTTVYFFFQISHVTLACSTSASDVVIKRCSRVIGGAKDLHVISAIA